MPDEMFDEATNRKSLYENKPQRVPEPSTLPASQADVHELRKSVSRLEQEIADIHKSSVYQELRVLKAARTMQDEIGNRAIEMARLNVTTASEVARTEITDLLVDRADARTTDTEERISKLEALSSRDRLHSRIALLVLVIVVALLAYAIYTK